MVHGVGTSWFCLLAYLYGSLFVPHGPRFTELLAHSPIGLPRLRTSIMSGKSIFESQTFCLITGASQGLGRTIAIKFAGVFPAGSVLVLMARNAKGLEQTKSTIEANSPSVRVRTIPVDLGVADEDSLRQYLAKVVKELEVVAGDFEQACVVHNAGSLGDVSKHVTQHVSTTEMRKYWDINLTSAVVLNAVFLGMFPPDEVRQRVVIQTSSICALQPFKSWSLYCAGRPNMTTL